MRNWSEGSFEKFANLAGREILAFFPLLEEETLIVNSFLMSSQNILLFISILS